VLEANSVVKAPELGVPPPIAPGAANVAPLKELAFRFGTLVVLATEKGAVPVANVEVIWPVTLAAVMLVMDAAVRSIALAPLEPDRVSVNVLVPFNPDPGMSCQHHKSGA